MRELCGVLCVRVLARCIHINRSPYVGWNPRSTGGVGVPRVSGVAGGCWVGETQHSPAAIGSVS